MEFAKPRLGAFVWHYRIEDNELVSEYRSAQNNYRGSERFTYLDDDYYTVEGVLYKGRKKVSSWSVVLRRQHGAKSRNRH
ncbi:MAG TPA: hypothetical protein VIM41_13390 [Gammaproteobacteria bacterium]